MYEKSWSRKEAGEYKKDKKLEKFARRTRKPDRSRPDRSAGSISPNAAAALSGKPVVSGSSRYAWAVDCAARSAVWATLNGQRTRRKLI